MAGRGKRFEDAGYSFPKPLIDVNGKPMIQIIIENLNLTAKHIFICQEEHVEKFAIQDLINSGIKTSFTKKELDSLGIDIPKIQVTTDQIKSIREEMNISQTVFAKILNVSPSSIRQWEQGKRTPSGSTKVLLELLETSPHLLDYRLKV